jgi:hypothetical protein
MSGENEPENPLSEQTAGAIYLHELYRSYIQVGFTNEQAFALVTTTLTTMLQLGIARGGGADE